MINIDEMKEFLGGDEEFIAKIIEKFILEVGNDLEKTRAASEEGNYAMVRALAHKMLSSTRIFGIDEFSNRLETIETLAEEKKELERISGLIGEMEVHWIDVVEETKHLKERLRSFSKK